MKTEDFNYNLPKNLIAQKPIRPRENSRLMVLSKKSGKISLDYFFNILKYLQKGDVLVFNNTKVIPARLYAKKETKGKVEVFLLSKIDRNVWEVLLRGHGIRKGIINIRKIIRKTIKNENQCFLVKNITSSSGAWSGNNL